jgi:hypothetical protein
MIYEKRMTMCREEGKVSWRKKERGSKKGMDQIIKKYAFRK